MTEVEFKRIWLKLAIGRAMCNVRRSTTGEDLVRAKEAGVCRVCGKPVYLPVDPEYPQEFDKFYGRVVKVGDTKIALDYGEEFAHQNCLLNLKDTNA